MGILKGIIDRFRAMGKTEKEISGIIETAADKATANPDVTKPEKPKKPEIKIETTAEAFVEAVLRTGTTLQQAKTAILKMSSLRDAKNRKNTNNWRKMHGLPMRRKQKARKKHERGKKALASLKEDAEAAGEGYKYDALEAVYIKGKTYEDIVRETGCGRNSPKKWCRVMIQRLSIKLFGAKAIENDKNGVKTG